MQTQLLALFGIVSACSAARLVKRADGDQNPKIWDALDALRGKKLTIEDITQLLANAVPGRDYPVNSVLPDPNSINCNNWRQPGFYADDNQQSRCQIFYRCDNEGLATAYLCPNQTLFNQITLICDWFYNVECANSKQFENYSNSRLGDENAHLLDDQMEYEVQVQQIQAATGAVQSAKSHRRHRKVQEQQ